MNNKFFSRLKNQLIEVYSGEDSSRFDVGIIVLYDNDWILLQTYDNFGSNDGLMLLRADTIYKINYNTQYIKNLKCLTKEFAPKIKTNKNETLFSSFIDQIGDDNLVSIVLSNNCEIVGKLEEDDDDYLLINLYLENGLPDGSAFIFKDEVTCIQLNTEECKKIQKNIAIQF